MKERTREEAWGEGQMVGEMQITRDGDRKRRKNQNMK